MILTLDIVNKIRDNCKHSGTYVGYANNEDKDDDLTFWVVNVFKPTTKEFKQYSLIEEVFDSEYDKYTAYNITLEDGDNISEDYEIATNEEVDDYNLEDWLNEYEEELETDEEVIRLVEEYLHCELRIENSGE